MLGRMCWCFAAQLAERWSRQVAVVWVEPRQWCRCQVEDGEGALGRRHRVLAPHPDGYLPGQKQRHGEGGSTCPGYARLAGSRFDGRAGLVVVRAQVLQGGGFGKKWGKDGCLRFGRDGPLVVGVIDEIHREDREMGLSWWSGEMMGWNWNGGRGSGRLAVLKMISGLEVRKGRRGLGEGCQWVR